MRKVRWVAAVLLACAVAFGIFNILQKQSVCRARQAEARINLRALSSLEASYRQQSGEYTASLSKLQFTPESRNYIYGFAGQITAGAMTRGPAPRPIGERDLPPGTGASKDHFRAAAVGDVHGEDDGLDVWLIDESGAAENTLDDCRWTNFHAFSGG